MSNFFVMIMWLSGGDAFLMTGGIDNTTLRFESRRECEVRLLEMWATNSALNPSIEQGIGSGNPTLTIRNDDNSLNSLVSCEEVKF